MSWLSGLCLLVVTVSMVGFGADYQFGPAGEKAQLSTRLVNRDRGPASIEFELTVPSLNLTADGMGFQALSAPGLTPMNRIGNPDLFTTGVLVAVPSGYEPRITVEASESREIQNVIVAPAQHKTRCAGGEPDSFSFNANLYQSPAVYPRQVVSIEEVGKIQDFRIVRVGIYPTQNDLGKKILTVTTSLKGRLDFITTGEGVRPFSSSPIAELVRKTTVNGNNVAGGNRGALAADVMDVMLVVTADGLKAAIAPFVEWKQSKGIKVDVATLTEAGGTKEKIKEYVQKYYDTAVVKPSYLLFVGNKTTMPAFTEATASGPAASDYRFALLSGDDFLPDAFYGRIIADNAIEVANQINRWLEYEKNPDLGALWYKSGMTIASDEGSGPSDQEYAEMIQVDLKKNTYTAVDQFYAGTSTATAANISAALKEGRSWLAYFGHGSGTSWGSTNDAFGNTQVAALENRGQLPILIDVACLNASWVNLANPFGKAWVNASKEGVATGAVAFYGGSVSISWHEPAVMSVGVAKYHFENKAYSLGGSALAGQLYLIEKMGTGDNVWDNLEWYNLFGDPSMLVRTDTPASYSIKHRVLESGSGNSVQVTATNTQGVGVANVVVAIRGTSGNPVAIGKTDANGMANVEVSGVGQLEPGSVLTTTGYNLETYQTTIQ